MMRLRNLATSVAVVATLSMGVATQALAQDFMSQKQILATIPGATLYGVSSSDGKTKWAQAYSKGGKKGKINGVWGDKQYKANWYVKGDTFCEKGSDYDSCWNIVRVDEKTLQAYKKGGKKTKNPWYIK